MQLQLGRLELALRSLHDSQLTGRGVSALAGIAHGIGAAFVGNPAALIKAGGQLFGVGLAKLGMEKARMLHRPLDQLDAAGAHIALHLGRALRARHDRATSARGKLAAIGGGAAAAAAALGGAAGRRWRAAPMHDLHKRVFAEPPRGAARFRRAVALSIGASGGVRGTLGRGAARAERRDRQPSHRLRRARCSQKKPPPTGRAQPAPPPPTAPSSLCSNKLTGPAGSTGALRGTDEKLLTWASGLVAARPSKAG